MVTDAKSIRPAKNPGLNVMAGDADLCTMETTSLSPSLSMLPAEARVWVYKSAVAFTPDQAKAIKEQGAVFTGSWVSHGDAVFAASAVLHDHFVVIAADLREMKICGGAIDGSVQFIKKLENDLGLQLTDRMVVLYEKDGAVQTCRVPEVEALVRSGVLHADTIVFDDLVTTKADMDARFRTPLRNSWMSRYL